MKSKKGVFITFEGCEGCGKTTQIGLLSERLQKANKEILVTREPGGTTVGEMVRNILIGSGDISRMCPETELLLFAACRAQLVREVLIPELNKGKFILCDRFLDSTTVYQGIARQLAQGPVKAINDFAVGDLMPDLTIVLDIPSEESRLRVQRRVNSVPDRIEKESIDFYAAVREGYLYLAKELPERLVLIDGSKGVKEVSQAVWEAVETRFFK
ncbi:MAG: dTMP kinase [bacterium]